MNSIAARTGTRASILLSLLLLALIIAPGSLADGGENQNHTGQTTEPTGADAKIKFKNWLFLPAYVHAVVPPQQPTPLPSPTPTPAPTATPQPTTEPPQSVTRIENDDARLSYTGVWQTQSASDASGGSFALTSWPLSAVELTFSGDQFVFYRAVGIEYGQAQVSIDGRVLGLLQFNFIEGRRQVPAYFQDLGPGQHVLRLEPPKSSIVVVPMPAFSVDMVMLPSPTTTSAAQEEAVRTLNQTRRMVGLPDLNSHLAVHQAAQNHAEFYANHKQDPAMQGLGFHGEAPNLAGYTGADPTQRAAYFGYLGLVGEVGSFMGNPQAGIDSLLATVYHRDLLLDYSYTEVGYGVVSDERGNFDVIDVGYNQLSPNIAPQRMLLTYPANGQQNVPPGWNGMEIPDPIPGAAKPVGYPISLHIVQPGGGHNGNDLGAVTSAELSDANGAKVPVHLLHKGSDPNHWLDGDTVFLIPTSPLRPHSTYTAIVTGQDSTGVKYSHTWQFCTGESS